MSDPIDPAAAEAFAPAKRPAASPPAAPRTADLSREIEQAVSRLPLDRVKCAHVFGPYYRCNWWAPNFPGNTRDPQPEWAQRVDARVRKSRFISAVITADKLQITELAD